VISACLPASFCNCKMMQAGVASGDRGYCSPNLVMRNLAMRNFLSKNSTLIIILVAAGFFVFAFNLHNVLFWDDADWIVNNPAVHSLSWENIKFWFTHNTLAGIGLQSNYYRPFLFFTFAFNYIIGGIKPFGYHLLSNLIHIGNAILVFYILNLAVKKRLAPLEAALPKARLRSPGGDLPLTGLVAFLTAFFFLIHPLQTEAVTYISGRGDPLSVFFILIGLLLFCKSLSRSSIFYFLFSIFSLILALLSRETAIIFPLLLMVFYIAFLSGEKFLRSLKTAFIKALPYFAVVFTYGILRLTVLNFKNILNFYDQPNIYSSRLYVRIFTFLKVLLVYFKLLIVPTGLHMERSMDPQLSLWRWPVLLGILIVALIIWIGIVLYKRDKITNYKLQITNKSQIQNSKNFWDLGFGAWDFRIWLFGFGWFFVALAPVSGITPINALIYEHWLYLPMVGFWFIVAFYLTHLFDYLRKNQKLLFVICVLLFGAYISFFGFQSVKRNILWGKPIPFYEDILKYEPDSVRINNNVGNMYYNEGNVAKAEEFYKKAVASEDIFPQPHFNLGSILQSRGDTFGAIQEYKKAIEIDPNFYYAYQNLASIYAQQGDLSNAALMLEKVKKLRPNDPQVLYNLGLVYLAQNKVDLARENLNLALKYSANDPQASAEIRRILDKLPQN
jgi:tetratricopeptide (TPR) repeat protein